MASRAAGVGAGEVSSPPREAEPLERLAEIRARIEHLRRDASDLGERAQNTIAQTEAARNRAQARDRARSLRADLDAALDEINGLRVAMQTRGVIEQAKGMIMITLHVDEQTAFDVLVKRSQTSHLKLVDVARDIVTTGAQPKRPEAR